MTSAALALLLATLVVGVQATRGELREFAVERSRLGTVAAMPGGDRLRETGALVWAFQRADGDSALQGQVQDLLGWEDRYYGGQVTGARLRERARAFVGSYEGRLKKGHDRRRRDMAVLRGVIGVSGLFALGCLAWLQIYLARRYRRMFNPALLVAIGVTAMYTFTGLSVLGKESAGLQTVNERLAVETPAASAGFETALRNGGDNVRGLPFLLPTAVCSIAVFVLVGVAPRLREFR